MKKNPFGFLRPRRALSATRVIALVFLGIILLGSLLLMLPVASRSGVSCGFRGALFTATSATCVTGLSLYDTYTQWSPFGQAIILCLIEIGGLGFMSAATVMVFLFRKKIGLRERLVMAQALSVNDMAGIVRLEKTVIVGSLSIQALGAAALSLHFLPRFGLRRALIWGVFHSVSAFCNAGFDIFGALQPGSSVAVFQEDPFVLLVLSLLVVVGGLGFLVWQELAQRKPWKKLSIYTKLVLITTAVLLLGGWGFYALIEWDNPATIGSMPILHKLVNAFFQSVTLRTAGFASFDQGGLTDGGKAFAMLLMLIGGSSGSTAGGLKTVTFLVVVLFAWNRARGKENVCVFYRTIPNKQVLDAMTISFVMVFFAFVGGIFICTTSPVSLTDGIYEAVSAIGTVGLTAGATGLLSIPAQYLIIVFMYFGRVGVLTISLGLLMGSDVSERIRYAETNLLIG